MWMQATRTRQVRRSSRRKIAARRTSRQAMLQLRHRNRLLRTRWSRRRSKSSPSKKSQSKLKVHLTCKEKLKKVQILNLLLNLDQQMPRLKKSISKRPVTIKMLQLIDSYWRAMASWCRMTSRKSKSMRPKCLLSLRSTAQRLVSTLSSAMTTAQSPSPSKSPHPNWLQILQSLYRLKPLPRSKRKSRERYKRLLKLYQATQKSKRRLKLQTPSLMKSSW